MDEPIKATIRELWLNTTLTQEEISVIVGVTPDSLSRYVATEFTKDERKKRIASSQSASQVDIRLPRPHWYTGKGKSVPQKILVYCKHHGLTCLPPGKSVVFADGDKANYSPTNLMVLDCKDAKKLNQLRVLQNATHGI